MADIVKVENLTKVYDSGFTALKGVNLAIQEGEIIALLGPNGAGKTTLISTICGITTPTEGTVTVGGHDTIRDYREARSLIGLVPQEVNLQPLEFVRNTVEFTRGLFGQPRDDAFVEKVLRDLSLWDKADSRIIALSGGMKRRVLIAKALSHAPRVLFLDEPTAGVDVELRKDMWAVVEKLRQDGVTIILTTHYIEEAEAIADRIGVISNGEILLVEDKATLMQRLGHKEMRIELSSAVTEIPTSLASYGLILGENGQRITYSYRTTGERTGITALLKDLQAEGLLLKDVQTTQSSLEDIFVELVKDAS